MKEIEGIGVISFLSSYEHIMLSDDTIIFT